MGVYISFSRRRLPCGVRRRFHPLYLAPQFIAGFSVSRRSVEGICGLILCEYYFVIRHSLFVVPAFCLLASWVLCLTSCVFGRPHTIDLCVGPVSEVITTQCIEQNNCQAYPSSAEESRCHGYSRCLKLSVVTFFAAR